MRRLNSYGVLSFDLLGFIGSYQKWCLISCLVRGIVGETFVRHLEFSTDVFIVVHMEGTFEDVNSSDDQLLL